MIDVIIKFSRVLYEPLSITVLIAMVLAFYLNWRKWNRLFWVIGGSIALMITWRMGMGIISSRYASILIYPTIILVVYLFYRVTELFPKIPYLCKIPKACYPWLSRALLIGMLVPCVIKDFRFNYYADFIPESGKVIKADMTNYQFPVILDLADEAARMQYYTGVESQTVYISGNSEKMQQDIEKSIGAYRFLHDVIYVVVNEKVGEFLESVGTGKWELISSKFKNNRKRIKFNVYRYSPLAEHKFWVTVEPEQWTPSEFLVPNGGFEQFTIITSDNERTNLFRRNELLFFFNDFKFPALWSIWGTIGFERGCNAEVENSEDAIYGKYSLRMKSSGNIACYGAPVNKINNYRLEFLSKGKINSRFAVSLYQYSDTDKYLEMSYLSELKMFSDRDVFSYQIPISKEDFHPEAAKFRLCFLLRHGEIFIDEVSLTPLSDE